VHPIYAANPDLPAVVNGQLDSVGQDAYWTDTRIFEEIALVEDDLVTPLAGASGWGLTGAVRAIKGGGAPFDLTSYLSWSTLQPETLVLDIPSDQNTLGAGLYVYQILVVDGTNQSMLLHGQWELKQRA
jgi:hypothetical protein